jgi:hypothetical protein
MLDGCHDDRGKVEHLAPDLSGDRGTAKIIPTPLAALRHMFDDLVGFGHRCEVLPRRPRLLAWLLA